MNPENIIIEGKGYLETSRDLVDATKDLKHFITKYLANKQYSTEDIQTYFSENNFLTMSFRLHVEEEKEKKFQKLIGTLKFWEDQDKNDGWCKALKNIQPRVPFRITVNLTMSPKDRRIYIKVRSEPALLYKRRAYGYSNLNEFDIKDAIVSNSFFASDLLESFNTTIIDEPKPLDPIYHSDTIQKLENLGFNKIASLLRRGKSRIYKEAEIEDGLTDLRSSFELFLELIVQRIGGVPKKKIGENLQILKDKGFLNPYIFQLINSITSKLNGYLSEVPVHDREKMSLADANFSFSALELIMDLIIDKALYRSS